MKRSARLLLPLFFAAPAPALALPQDVPYEKYRLDNGLTVILHEDHSLPQVAVNLWFYVGSKDEPRGRSGFAHLFEHLMFMGTERAPGSGFDDIMEAGGGSNNATTSTDRTNYFSSGPAELLPTLLWLEADRIEDLGRMMTQEKLDKQREVVRNERRQSAENRPYGRASLKTSELLYPPGHPYHDPVIGSHADLEAATVEDVQSFFATYYVPNNASLVVAGDFDPVEAKRLVDELFGSLPRGADVLHAAAEPVQLEGQIVYTMTDRVQFARTTMSWHSPASYQNGDAEMDLVAAILSDGISSRLYQALVVERPLAVDVSAYQGSKVLGSTFTLSATARAGVELAELEEAVDEVLARFLTEGPTAGELERQKAAIEYSSLSGLQSIRAKADRLNGYEFHFGEPNAFALDLDRFRNATPEGVRAWAQHVLDPERRLVLRVLPEAQAPEQNPRDVLPETGLARPFAPAGPSADFELSNGVRVQHWERRELPLVELRVLLPFGSAEDRRAKGGLASLTADMLDEGAGERGAVEFADALDQLGASFEARAGVEWTDVTLSALRRNFDEALELAADALLRPRFDEAEWQRVHDLHLQDLRRQADSPNFLARTVSLRAFFGDEHPYGRPTDGTPESAAAVTLEDVRAFQRERYHAAGARILVAGDLSADEARAKLEAAFGGIQAGALERPPGTARELPPPAGGRLRVVLVDRPGAVQTVVRFMLPAVPYAAEDRPARELVALILGGSFTSRLNANLREDKGYSYGANARFFFGTSTSYLVASSSVRTDVTGAALSEFLKEFEALRGRDVTAVEAEKARATTRQRLVSGCATLGGLLRTASGPARHGLPFAALASELALVSGLGEADLNALAASTVPVEEALLVLVGDADAVLPQLEGLGLPAAERLDARGDPVTRD